jgi:hypothetical protein
MWTVLRTDPSGTSVTVIYKGSRTTVGGDNRQYVTGDGNGGMQGIAGTVDDDNHQYCPGVGEWDNARKKSNRGCRSIVTANPMWMSEGDP